MPHTVYNQKSHFLPVGSGTTTTYSPSNTKFSLQCILKSIKTFLIQSYFYSNIVILKNTKKTKKTGTNFDLTTDSSIEKYYTILIKFKIRISQLIAKILKQRSLNQITHCLTGHNQI